MDKFGLKNFENNGDLSCFKVMSKFRKVTCTGFTMSEVLIALLIIGVIAALTIPLLVQNWQRRSWETGQKKFLANLIQVTGMMNLNNELSGYATTEDFMTNFGKYMKSAKTCTNTDLSGCFSTRVKPESGNTLLKIDEWKTAEDLGETFKSNIAGMKLNNGQELLIAYNPACPMPAPIDTATSISMCMSVMYDVNGDKKPNTLGKDVYKLNAQDISDYIAQNPPSITVPDSDETTDTGSGDSGSGGGSGSGSSGDSSGSGGSGSGGEGSSESGTGSDSGGGVPPAGDLGADAGGTGTGNAGGGYKDCVYVISDGTCITKILGTANGGYMYLTYDQCTKAKNSGNIDVDYCYNGNDYYAGAVFACGGKKANLPSQHQLALIATDLLNYNVGDSDRISADPNRSGYATVLGLTLDLEKAAIFLNLSPYSDWFLFWSNIEKSTSQAYGRFIGIDATGWDGDGYRFHSDRLVFCVW